MKDESRKELNVQSVKQTTYVDATGPEIDLAYFIADRLDEQDMVRNVDDARGVVLRALIDFRVENE